MRTLARESMEVGAAGVMIAPPNTLRTDDSIVGYYRQTAEAIGADVPFVIQDYPLTFSVQMTPSVIRRIVQDNASCAMLKHEDWPGLEKISMLRLFERDASMRRISILCGNGGLFLDFETERGADGAMTGYCFPDMLVELVALARAGERERVDSRGADRQRQQLPPSERRPAGQRFPFAVRGLRIVPAAPSASRHSAAGWCGQNERRTTSD